jgi:hypothetical protein
MVCRLTLQRWTVPFADPGTPCLFCRRAGQQYLLGGAAAEKVLIEILFTVTKSELFALGQTGVLLAWRTITRRWGWVTASSTGV